MRVIQKLVLVHSGPTAYDMKNRLKKFHVLLLSTSLSITVGLGCAYVYEASVLAAEQDRLRQLQPHMQRLHAGAANLAPSADLRTQLPRQMDASNVLARLQRLATQHGVILASVAPSKDGPNKPSSDLLRAAWDVQLNGAYIPIKAMLAEFLEQGTGVWLSQAQFKAVGAGIQAHVTLQAWSYSEPTLHRREGPK